LDELNLLSNLLINEWVDSAINNIFGSISAVTFIILEEIYVLLKEFQKLSLLYGWIQCSPNDGVIKYYFDDWSFFSSFGQKCSINERFRQIRILQSLAEDEVSQL
jgi:hypothetical protein